MALRPISLVDRGSDQPHHNGNFVPQAYFSRVPAVAGLSHRQTEILNIARAFGRVMVEDLAKRFEVSAQTIRKDLNDLCDQRSLTRIHGGAIIAGVAAVTSGEKSGQGIPKHVITDGPVVTKANAAGMQWMEEHFLI